MNEFVSCLLDGDYWNSSGPRRKPNQRFTLNDEFKISIRRRGPSQPLTPEQRQRNKDLADRRRAVESQRREVDVKRALERQKREEEGVLLFGDRVLLGGENVAQKHNVVAVLNVTERVPNFHAHLNKFQYKRIYVLDTNDQEIMSKFGEAAAFIAEHTSTPGARVLVHCKQGRSRSPSFVLAYAMQTLRYSLGTAWGELCSVLGEANLNINANFQRQLMHYEVQLFQRATHDFHARERKAVTPFSPSKVTRGQSSNARIVEFSYNEDEEMEADDNEKEEIEEKQEKEEVDDGGGEAESSSVGFVLSGSANGVAASQNYAATQEVDTRDHEPRSKPLSMKRSLDEMMGVKANSGEDVRILKRPRLAEATASGLSFEELLKRLDEAHSSTAEALERAHTAERMLLDERRQRVALELRLLNLEMLHWQPSAPSS